MSQMPDSDAGVLGWARVVKDEEEALGAPAEGGRAALCLSGGGIRSATFCLGVLQALAELKLLTRFDYLSTVSGGGYIGGWLAAWIDRHPRAAAGVEEEIVKDGEQEAEAVRNLRRFSNYLSPQPGLLSTDTWTLAATVGRNLLLNWMVLAPLLAALAMAPALCVAVVAIDSVSLADVWIILAAGSIAGAVSVAMLARELPRFGDRNYSQAAVGLAVGTLLFLAVLCWTTAWIWLWVSEAGRSIQGSWWEVLRASFLAPPAAAYAAGWAAGIVSLKRREGAFLRRAGLAGAGMAAAGASQGAVLLRFYEWAALNIPPEWLERFYVAVSMPVCVIVIVLLAAVASVATGSGDDVSREWWARFGGWLLMPAVSWFAFSAVAVAGPIVLSNAAWLAGMSSTGAGAGGLTAWLGYSARTHALPALGKGARRLSSQTMLTGVIAPAFLAVLLVLLSAGGEALTRWVSGASEPGVWPRAGVMLGLAAASLLASLVVPVNKFSLHSMYRNRLVRAYLGASREGRTPNWFTGFDDKDNIYLGEMKNRRPLHIINAALNDVAGKELAWQQRKARSFTFSRLHAGFGDSYRGMKAGEQCYGGKSGASLGTAMAISGAAVSSNMGYNSSPLVTFLLTLLNARLGWWLGNPGPSGDRTWRLSSPRFSLKAILTEAFGRTASDRAYVYLSDGGHFENLGLYEMVRRRCRWIVAVDASADPETSFEDLGNALRRIRVDFGAEIDFKTRLIRIEDPDPAQCRTVAHCAYATIRYHAAGGSPAEGELLYIKPALTGDEPPDVRHYRKTAATFPHQSTGDQFFDEPQFESYRKLGYHSVKLAAEGRAMGTKEYSMEVFFDEMSQMLPSV